MKISLIMATVGRSKEIDRLIDSLLHQTSSAFELIIVDQNPDTRLEPVLQRLSTSSSFSHKHIVTDQKGLSIARNIAFPHVSHEIVGYPDDDCWYEDGVVGKVIEYFENNPEADGVIGRWCEMDVDFEEGFLLNAGRWRRFRLGISAFSSCLFFRRGLVERVGGFDERLGVPQWFNSGEEIDLVIRSLNEGASLRYVPNIRIHHPVKSILEGRLDEALKRVRNRSRGVGGLYRKHCLSWFVIGRGLLSPFLKSFLPPYSFRKILANLAIILGRVEGMFFWNEPKK
jgi:glycosyltransferase involved in cell wall biosynthesis